ncbi:4Fe-4S single cluster domain-containing protein [Nitrosomonas sp. Nm51]|uniref:radical SAM protein n=1 Tax=Nitrosomonas sp. Nm51 TaxID=133720 RepID=UPI0008D7F77F|nr:radical SAM protein [Nitrosomonas sp. Nm51]SER59045.1 4Fe-4S single cluster domain-containing protein [Nitrosomonas sp. Nm51]
MKTDIKEVMAIAPARTEKPYKRSPAWYVTSKGEPRGFVRAHGLDELWLHTGTACNLSCPFCLEGSRPGDNRLQLMRFDDAKPYIDEALTLGVQQFSLTGGEPFINKDIVRILDYALRHRPCLVLTNATEPLIRRMHRLQSLLDYAHPLHFRVSLDHFDAAEHDKGRGEGMFALALEGMRRLHEMGFQLSVASQILPDMAAEQAAQRFASVFRAAGLPESLHRIEFPEFYPPETVVSAPQITQSCMLDFQTEASRREFMCAFSRMVVKQSNRCRVYACTLVDDDADYALAETLTESLKIAVSMKHHRCYSCFKFGASCSEMK